jgi:hypothetical protein
MTGAWWRADRRRNVANFAPPMVRLGTQRYLGRTTSRADPNLESWSRIGAD